jgi:hypothetical protein
MPKVMKPPSGYNADDVLTGGDWYDGPPPKAGFYKGPIKKILLQKGKNPGQIRWMVLCEINHGPFKGAGVVKWIEPDGDNAKWFNQWLHSLTDGSEEQMRAIRKSFAENGFMVDKDDKGKTNVVRIGKNTNPIGKVIGFVVKQRTIQGGERDGEVVAEISRFAVPKGNDEETEEDSPESVLDDDDSGLDDTETVETDDDSSGLDEFDGETTSNPEPAEVATGSSDDDPWSL